MPNDKPAAENAFELFDAKNYVDAGILLTLIASATPEQASALSNYLNELDKAETPPTLNKSKVTTIIQTYRDHLPASSDHSA